MTVTLLLVICGGFLFRDRDWVLVVGLGYRCAEMQCDDLLAAYDDSWFFMIVH